MVSTIAPYNTHRLTSVFYSHNNELTMTLTFFLEGHGHILFPLFEYVGLKFKINNQLFVRYHDLSAYVL